MFYKLGKKIFHYLVHFLKSIQIALLILSFLSLIYWILKIAKYPMVVEISRFFDSIESFIHIFYTRRPVVGGVEVDFAFLVAVLMFLGIVWGLKHLIEYLQDVEDTYDLMHRFLKKQVETSFNRRLYKEYVKEELKFKHAFLCVKFNLSEIVRAGSFGQKKYSDEDKKETLDKVFERFLEELNGDFKFHIKIKNGNIFIYVDINSIDKAILKIEDIILKLKAEYKPEKWNLEYYVSVDVYSKDNELQIKQERLVVLQKLLILDKMICFSTFMHRYLLLKDKNYEFETQGLYEILTSIEEEVFALVKLR